MIAVMFEVWPKHGHKQEYLNEAAELRALLESLDGFISVERFASLTDTGKLLSLSFFDSEEAVQRWRNVLRHKQAQSLGRQSLFDNYRIRVAEVFRDYGMHEREQAPSQQG